MDVFKTLVPLDDGIDEIDTIEYEGALWLVPEWIDTARKGWSRPARIVCLSLLEHTPMPPESGCRFVVANPIPTAVLGGQVPPQSASQYVVVDLPEIEVETRSSATAH